MRILVVDEEIPWPANSGKRLRTFNLLKNLTARHEISFVCRRHEGAAEVKPTALEEAGIRTIVVPHAIRRKSGLRFYGSLLANLLSRYPYSVSSHYSKELQKTIGALLAGNSFDLIHCEWTPYAINLKPYMSLPTVVDAHNVEAMVWRRTWQVETNVFKKAYSYWQWRKMEFFERRYLPLFSRTVAVSPQDAEVISQWVGPDQVDVVANGVDMDYFKPAPIPPEKHSMVFTGALDWRPNVEGVLYFLEKIFPLIRKQFPQSSLTIVGRNPLRVLKDRVARIDGVSLTGTVDDVRPFMNAAAVFIVPLRVGGGSRLKILEAFAMSKPVVSTTVGAEGLNIRPGQDILLADGPRDFAEAVGRIFSDVDLGGRLGAAGRQLVTASYQWKVAAERLEKNWRLAVEGI